MGNVLLVKTAFARHRKEKRKVGLPTGFWGLDKLTSGLQAGELIVIVGRRSMGKTALAMNIAANVALRQRRPVGVISMTGNVDGLISRFVCSLAKVGVSDLTKPLCRRRWQIYAGKIVQSPLVLETAKTLTIRQLCDRARRMKQRSNIQLLIVDSLQLLRANRRSSLVAAHAQVARGLKLLARKLNVPVIVLSRLPKSPKICDAKAHRDARPAIVQAADMVGLLIRPEMYSENKKERIAAKGKATLIIAKHRNGQTGDVKLTFLSKYLRFENPKKSSTIGEQA